MNATPGRAESGTPSPLPSSATQAIAVLGGLLIVVAVYAGRSIRNPFFADDYLFLEQVRGRTLWAALASPDPIGNFLRPVSRALYFWLVSHVGGESPATFHLFSLLLFGALLVCLYGLARRVAGVGVAAFAVAFVGFHYAADVPLLWASGSQDLLAATAAVLALWLYLTGHRLIAACVFLIGLLSKESVAVVPLIAILTDVHGRESWKPAARRAWPLLAVAAIWSVIWLATASSRPAAASAMSADAAALPAALWHLVQVAAGLEVGQTALGTMWLLGALGFVAAAAIAVLLANRIGHGPDRELGGEESDRALRLGLGWAVLAALPVAAVASIWSAYFYLFALCGLGIALGALVQRWPVTARVAVLSILVLASARARALEEFATGGGPWSSQSHVNRCYVDRAMDTSARYIQELRSSRPQLPHGSTVFFAEVPPSIGFQTADGPLVRWAYQDSSLRSYYLTELTAERLARGPAFFFAVENGSLRDHTDDPTMLASTAYTMIIKSKPRVAAQILDRILARTPNDQVLRYWLAWSQWAVGDTTLGKETLVRAGVTPLVALAPSLDATMHLASSADTAKAITFLLAARNRSGLTPQIHSRLAALCLLRPEYRQLGVIEAFALTTLSPNYPDAWRKWAAAQLAERQYDAAAKSLGRYFALGGAKAQQDLEARQVLASLNELLGGHGADPGGPAPGP
jgi:hypothetical protein